MRFQHLPKLFVIFSLAPASAFALNNNVDISSIMPHTDGRQGNYAYSTTLTFLSNMNEGYISAAARQMLFSVGFDHNYGKRYEIEVDASALVRQDLQFYVGGDFKRTSLDKTADSTAIAGVRYIVPLAVRAELRINHEGKARFGLCSDITLGKRMVFAWYWNTDQEYQGILRYPMSKHISISGGYNYLYHWGAGIRFNF